MTLSGAGFATLVPIRNMGRAIRFYTRTLGGKLLMRAEGEMRDSWASVKIGKSDFWLISPERQERRALAYNSFIVKDIRKTVRNLKAKGVKFQRAERSGSETEIEGPISFNPWGAAAFFKDSEGNLQMLWEGQ